MRSELLMSAHMNHMDLLLLYVRLGTARCIDGRRSGADNAAILGVTRLHCVLSASHHGLRLCCGFNGRRGHDGDGCSLRLRPAVRRSWKWPVSSMVQRSAVADVCVLCCVYTANMDAPCYVYIGVNKISRFLFERSSFSLSCDAYHSDGVHDC